MRQSDPTMPPARGTKTLGWFMDQTDIFEKQQQQQMMTPPVPMERRNSSSDESKAPSIVSNNTHHHQQHQQKKQKRYRKTLSSQNSAAARKDGYAASQAMSESSEEGCQVLLPPPVTLTTTSGGAGANNSQEEYWFYDVASDGYYYEQNGAKGWRRRQPNAAVHKGGKDQEVAHMNVNGPGKYNHLLAAQAAAAAQAALIQQAMHLQQQAAAATSPVAQQPQQQPTMRYYDPNSDGFFYEMASVDGWKRRQPNKPVSASVPAGITRPYSQRQADHQHQQQLQMMHAAAAALAAEAAQPTGSSYGAALARGQFPRNTVKSEVLTPAPESRDSASSSQCGDTFTELFGATDPVFNPIQRPSALNLEQKAVSPKLENNEANIKPFAVPSSQSPMKESWNSFRSCSLFSPVKPSKRVLAPAPVSSNHQSMTMTPLIDDMDDTMVMLIKDLDKLWANTPVTGLNQA